MHEVRQVKIEMSRAGILQALKMVTGTYEVLGHGYRKVMAYIIQGETIRLDIEMKNGKTQTVTYDQNLEVLYEEVI